MSNRMGLDMAHATTETRLIRERHVANSPWAGHDPRDVHPIMDLDAALKRDET